MVLSQLIDTFGVKKFETDNAIVSVIEKYEFDGQFSDEEKEKIDNAYATLKSLQSDAVARCEASGEPADLKSRYITVKNKK